MFRRFHGSLFLVVLAVVLAALGTGTAFAAEDEVPTFSKDIAPIFQAKCEACHRPNSIAPMSLVTYQESRPWARSIKDRVSTRQMPPWHIDRTVGISDFKNDRSLTDAEIDIVVRWVDGGAPRGNPADMPAAIEWPDQAKWYLADRFGGPPDLIVESDPFTMPAESNDAWWKPISETGLTEPRWVRAIEVRPGTEAGRKITHHVIARLEQDETDPLLQNPNATADNDPLANSGLFMEWAVGKEGRVMRPGSGVLMLPDSRIIWDVHYSASGEEITDNVRLGVYFYPKGEEPKNRQVLHLMGATGGGSLDIEPNTIAVTEGFFPLKRAARIESFQPHMHLRGKAMAIEAILPTGRREVLSHVGDFNFNWHNTYQYTDAAAPLLPKGTLMKVTAWHDNTAANRANPDPNVWVGYGDRTVDEMAHAWVNVTYFTDEEYDELLEARESADNNN